MGPELLRKYMDKRKLKGKDFAETLSMSSDKLSKILRGIVTPSIDDAARIEDATGGSVDIRSWITQEPVPAVPGDQQ